MKKLLSGVLFFLLLLLLSFFAVGAVFNIPPYLYKWLAGEGQIFRNLFLFSKGVFHNWYAPHAVVVTGIFMFGLYKIFAALYRLCIKQYRRLPAYAENKKGYLRLTAWLAAFVFFTGLLSFVEYLMRQKLVPGQAFSTFRPQDSLIVEQQILCDEMGVNYQNPLFKWPDTLHHVNAQGYFAPYDYSPKVVDSLRKAGRKIVFVIGDSFTEGVTATTFNKTFVEVLRNMQHNYAVFGFGVGGTDPLQYELVTRKFINLQPDLIVVAFCGQNDLVDFDRVPSPGVPILWQTNAGWMDSNIPAVFAGETNKILRSPQEAYSYYLQHATLIKRKDLTPRLFGKLQITTKLYFLPLTYKYRIKPMFAKAPDNAYKNLAHIDSIAAANKIPFAIAFVPNMDHVNQIKTRRHFINKYGHVFKHLQSRTYFPTGYTTRHFLNPDIHFNDEGNLKFALFVDSIVHQTLY